MKRASVLLLIATSVCGYEFNRDADGSPVRCDISHPIPWIVVAGAPSFVREAVIPCLAKWSSASGGAITFVEGTGGIVVDYKLDSQLGADMAYTSSEVSAHTIVSSIIELNASTYDWAGLYSQYLTPALMHELGHALGLCHPHDDAADVVGAKLAQDPPTMWSQLHCCARSLHYDDIFGLRTLYTLDTSSIETTLSCGVTHRGKLYNITVSDAPDQVYWDYGDGKTGTLNTHDYNRGTYIVNAISRGRAGTLTIQVGPIKKVKSATVQKAEPDSKSK